MESVTTYPKNEKQKSLLKSLLEKLDVCFEIVNIDTLMPSEEVFYAKIDKSI